MSRVLNSKRICEAQTSGGYTVLLPRLLLSNIPPDIANPERTTYKYEAPPSGTGRHFLRLSPSLLHFLSGACAQAGREITNSINTEDTARFHQFGFIFPHSTIVQNLRFARWPVKADNLCKGGCKSVQLIAMVGVANPCN